jgi:glycosyltransferase involved in cell wall biosynthesis
MKMNKDRKTSSGAGRVLYLAEGRNVSSANPGRKIRSLLECWRGMGWQVRALFGGDDDETLYGPCRGGGAARTLPCAPAFKAPGRGRRGLLKRALGRVPMLSHSLSERRDIRHNARNLDRIASVADLFGPDVIWGRSFRLHDAGLTVARRMNVPFVLEWKDHLIPYKRSLYRQRALELERAKTSRADYIAVESEVLRQRLADQGVDPGKILVTRNAADIEQFHPCEEYRREIRVALGARYDEVLIGYIGSYAFYHDAPRLVEAADELCRMGLRNWRILMIGSGSQYAATRQLASRLGLLGTKILMTGRVPDHQVPRMLSAMDVAVLPGSTDIICPIKVQEYMACGVPTVVPDYSCNREVIQPGENGECFEPGDADDLARKLAGLIRDESARRRIAEEGRRTICENFTWQATWGAALEELGRHLRFAAGDAPAGPRIVAA